jgi:hypothetical protein
MRWTASGAGRQRVDVSVLSNGFDTGQFESSAVLSPNTTDLVWERAHGEAQHRWRVLTRTPDGWVSSRQALFSGPGCVGVDTQ